MIIRLNSYFKTSQGIYIYAINEDILINHALISTHDKITISGQNIIIAANVHAAKTVTIIGTHTIRVLPHVICQSENGHRFIETELSEMDVNSIYSNRNHFSSNLMGKISLIPTYNTYNYS